MSTELTIVKRKRNRHSTGTSCASTSSELNKPDSKRANFNLSMESGGDSLGETSVMSESPTNAAEELELNLASIPLMTTRDLIEGIARDMITLKHSVKYNDGEIGDLKKRMTSAEKKAESQEAKINTLQNEVEKLKKAQVESQAYSMRPNLIFEHVPVSMNENLTEKIHNILEENMKIVDGARVNFERIHRMGQGARGKPPPVIVRFHNYSDRARVWKAKRVLHETGSDIFVREQYPAIMEENRRKLMPVYQSARESYKGAYMVRDKVFVKGRQYTVDNINELKKMLPESGDNIGIKMVNNVSAFLGFQCALSNFYCCSFQHGGATWNCVEQGYQAARAKYLGRDDIASAIRQMNDPREMKSATRNLDDKDWLQTGTAKKEMFDLVLAKFSQCTTPQRVLLKHGGRTIVEASPHDKYWGIGLSKASRSLGDPSTYKGSNTMGDILTKVAKILQNQSG